MTELQSNYTPDPYDDDIYSTGDVVTKKTFTAEPVRVVISHDETHPWRSNDNEMSVLPLDQFGPTYSGSGNLIVYGPPPGWYWDVHAIVCAGFTAGSVAMWKNDLITPAAERFPFTPSAGMITLGKAQCIVSQNDILYFVPTGITGTISVWFGGIKLRREVFQDYFL